MHTISQTLSWGEKAYVTSPSKAVLTDWHIIMSAYFKILKHKAASERDEQIYRAFLQRYGEGGPFLLTLERNS